MTEKGQEPTDAAKTAATEPEPKTEPAKTFDAEYVKSIRDEAAGYRIQLRELEAAQATKADADLADQAKWQELAEQRATTIAELEPVKTAYDAILENLKESNTKRVELIPEDRRSLVPEYDDPSKVAAWLDANAPLLSLPITAPNLNGGAGSQQSPGDALPVLSQDEIEAAGKMGLTPEQYQQSKAKSKTKAR